MRLGSSRRNNPNDSTPLGIGNAKHSTVDQADRFVSQHLGGTEIIEVDDIGIEEHLRGGFEVDPMLDPIGLFFAGIPLEIHDVRPPVY